MSKRIIICGWVRCGNRWLARLLAYYADGYVKNTLEQLFAENYWKAKLNRRYFGEDVEIEVSHHTAFRYWQDGVWSLTHSMVEDVHIVHLRRDPRDAFVSWYYTLLQTYDMLPMNRRTWKGYLSWLPGQQLYPFRKHAESWLDLERVDPSNVVWVSHEGMRADRAKGLLRLMAAIGFPLDRERALRAACIVEKEPPRMPYYGTRDPTERGKPGEWKRLFDAEDARLLEEHYGDLIRRLGYGGDPDWEKMLERTKSV